MLKRVCSAVLLYLCIATGVGVTRCYAFSYPEAVSNYDSRLRAILIDIAAHPPGRASCPLDKLDEVKCIWTQITHALVTLELSNDVTTTAEASRRIAMAADSLPHMPGWKRLNDPDHPESSARIDAAFDFPFLTAALLHRGVMQFGSMVGSRRLAVDAEQAIAVAFKSWTATECRLADADPRLVLATWGSENHDVQRAYACWAGADLATRFNLPVAYLDGSNATEQRDHWGDYFKAFIRSRARAGISVEYFSAGYSKYYLGVFYNLADFSEDKELAELSRNLITLWWAVWAQEQVDGIHGGSETRSYSVNFWRNSPLSDVAWLCFGLGRPSLSFGQPAYLPFYMTTFRLPEIVKEIADASSRSQGVESWSRQLGAAAAPRLGDRYSVRNDVTDITRYTYSAEGFVMGSAIITRLRESDWTAISSQNRWSGLALGGGLTAKVFAIPTPLNGKSAYNALFSAQSRGTQIVQRLPPPYSQGAGDMVMYIGAGLNVVERGGWLFSEGTAFVAMRPAFGGYVKDPKAFKFTLNDNRSPVIIHAAMHEQYSKMEEFQSAVLATDLRVTKEWIEFGGLDGSGRIRFFLDGAQASEVDGHPIQAPAGWTLYSPYVRQQLDTSEIELTVGDKRLVLRF